MSASQFIAATYTLLNVKSVYIFKRIHCVCVFSNHAESINRRLFLTLRLPRRVVIMIDGKQHKSLLIVTTMDFVDLYYVTI